MKLRSYEYQSTLTYHSHPSQYEHEVLYKNITKFIDENINERQVWMWACSFLVSKEQHNFILFL